MAYRLNIFELLVIFLGIKMFKNKMLTREDNLVLYKVHI